MAEEILNIYGLKKSYGNSFSLNIDRLYAKQGKILTIIGPNGSGKSTLIRLINLLEKPDSGKIYFNRHQILNGGTDPAQIRKKMAVVFQEPLLFKGSVYSNIIMGLKIRKIKPAQARERLDYCIGKLKLAPLLKRSTENLSGGEKHRVSLARALVLDPELLLLDEPLANIDQDSRERLRTDLLEVLRSYGKTVIYITHDRSEAMVLADDIAVMDKGKILQFAKKEEVFRKPKNEFIARFVGVETLINGVISASSGNVCRVKVESGGKNIQLSAAGQKPAGTRVTLAIRPEDVTLYNTEISPGQSSAMNMLEGTITEIKDMGIFKRVVIDCGFYLNSFITRDSVARLELCRGKEIRAAVKASCIHVFER
ncbi:MAG: ABC transporter ATP-binding protein [Actinomycetota bacterium]